MKNLASTYLIPISTFVFSWILPNLNIEIKIIICLSIALISIIYDFIMYHHRMSKTLKNKELEMENALTEQNKEFENIRKNREYLLSEREGYEKKIAQIGKLVFCLNSLENSLRLSFQQCSSSERKVLSGVYESFMISKKYMDGDSDEQNVQSS